MQSDWQQSGRGKRPRYRKWFKDGTLRRLPILSAPRRVFQFVHPQRRMKKSLPLSRPLFTATALYIYTVALEAMMEQLARVYNEKDRRTLEWLRQKSWRRGYYRRGRTLRRIGKALSLCHLSVSGREGAGFPASVSQRAESQPRSSLSPPFVASSPRRQDRRLRRSTSCIDVANNLQSIRLNPLRTLEAT
jgi:hypothetical protein